MKSKHSFAVLAYGDSKYLEDCIVSLLNQTIPSVVFISTSTPSPYIQKIAEKYQIEAYVNESPSGIHGDWNYAYACAQTKYVTLAHQDDVYLPEYTEKCLHTMEKGQSVIAFTDYREIGSESGVRKKNMVLGVKKIILSFFFALKNTIYSKCVRKMMLSFGNPVSCPTVMYNRSLLGDFCFSPDFSINLDWDAWYRCAEIDGGFSYIDHVLQYHRIHGESETSEGIKDNRRYNEDIIMFERFWPRIIVSLIMKAYTKSYSSNF